jgi:integrase/recombinase XerC
MNKRFEPTVLTADEVASLIEACGTTWTGQRNAALIAILYRCGPRIGEALGIDYPGDFELIPNGKGASRIRLRNVKGKGRGAPNRVIGLDPKTTRIVMDWCWRRGPAAGPLFYTATGHRMLPSYVRALLPRLAKRAGIAKRVHAHGLRHTFAQSFYEDGRDLVRTSRALGHRNVATTDGYLRSIGVTQAAEANMEREW